MTLLWSSYSFSPPKNQQGAALAQPHILQNDLDMGIRVEEQNQTTEFRDFFGQVAVLL